MTNNEPNVVDELLDENFPDKKCLMCKKIRDEHSGFGPSHNGSRFCESGSIASGGKRSHCTCDMCF